MSYYVDDNSLVFSIIAGRNTYYGKPIQECIMSDLLYFGRRMREDSFTFEQEFCNIVQYNCSYPERLLAYGIEPDECAKCELFGMSCYDPANACDNCRSYPLRYCTKFCIYPTR